MIPEGHKEVRGPNRVPRVPDIRLDIGVVSWSVTHQVVTNREVSEMGVQGKRPAKGMQNSEESAARCY